MLGRTIHNYQIVDRLGSGSMGAVYRARDTSLELDVAVKNLPEDVAADPQAFARFKRQVRAAMSLNHPNICAINTVLTENGQWFIIMELLEGQTLQGLLARATREVGATDTWTRPPLDVLTFFRLAIQIAEALIAADTKQLIHGGIKPANIIVTRRGDAKIMDYGLANLPGAAASSLPTGTVAYMSPEQVNGEEMDPRADLFSFGTVLYEMGTGRKAFTGVNADATLTAILEQQPPRPCELTRELPEELDRIITKAMEKDRNLRYQNASEILRDLERLRTVTDSWRHGPILGG